jgi:hypothetical protein
MNGPAGTELFGFSDVGIEIAAWATAITVVIGAAYAIVRAYRSLAATARHAVSTAVDNSSTGHLVKYHLGPNNGTTPVHERIRRLEVAHNIEDGDTPHEAH